MTTVALGSNLLTDCETIIAFGALVGLKIEESPLRLTMNTPDHPRSPIKVSVDRNEVNTSSPGQLSVVVSESSVAVFWKSNPLVIATRLQDGLISLKLDLRPVGFNIYDDAAALHIGSNQFTNNAFINAQVAFQLG